MRLLDATAPELRRGWGKHELEGILFLTCVPICPVRGWEGLEHIWDV